MAPCKTRLAADDPDMAEMFLPHANIFEAAHGNQRTPPTSIGPSTNSGTLGLRLMRLMRLSAALG